MSWGRMVREIFLKESTFQQSSGAKCQGEEFQQRDGMCKGPEVSVCRGMYRDVWHELKRNLCSKVFSGLEVLSHLGTRRATPCGESSE